MPAKLLCVPVYILPLGVAEVIYAWSGVAPFLDSLHGGLKASRASNLLTTEKKLKDEPGGSRRDDGLGVGRGERLSDEYLLTLCCWYDWVCNLLGSGRVDDCPKVLP